MRKVIQAQFHSPAYGYPVFPTPLIKANIIFLLCILGTFVKNKLMINTWVWGGRFLLYSINGCVCFYASTILS
jgi:hypothetical protein